jgi:hypothetical protein
MYNLVAAGVPRLADGSYRLLKKQSGFHCTFCCRHNEQPDRYSHA